MYVVLIPIVLRPMRIPSMGCSIKDLSGALSIFHIPHPAAATSSLLITCYCDPVNPVLLLNFCPWPLSSRNILRCSSSYRPELKHPRGFAILTNFIVCLPGNVQVLLYIFSIVNDRERVKGRSGDWDVQSNMCSLQNFACSGVERISSTSKRLFPPTFIDSGRTKVILLGDGI